MTPVCARASSSRRPTWANSGSVKVTDGTSSMVDLDRYAEQGVADHQAGVMIGDVRGVGPAGDVADRVDALVGGAQRAVDDDAARRAADAGGVEVEVLDIRPPPGGDEEMRALDRLRAGSAWRARPCTLASDAADFGDLDAGAQLDAVRTRAHRARRRRIRGHRSASGVAASSTVTSEPRRRNACASSRPTAPAPMTMRWRGSSARSKTVSLVRYGVSEEAGNRRHDRRGAGGDDEAARLDRNVADRRPCCGSVKRAAPSIDVHAEAGETFARRVRRHRADDVVARAR